MGELVEGPGRVRFGHFELDFRSGELFRNGRKVRLQELPFRALVHLIRHAGEVVSREDLQKTLWPADTFVDFDRGLNKAINKIRDALGDSAENAVYIETVPQRGYRFIAPVRAAEDNEPLAEQPRLDAPGPRPLPPLQLDAQPHSSRRRVIVLAAATTAGFPLLYWLTSGRSRESSSSAPQSSIKSIVVLPLRNISGDPSQEFLADGLTEELITEIASSASVRVISLTSSLAFKGTRRTVPEIAKELGVEAVVEGTVTCSGNRIRITAQLIDARNDKHIWSKKYERDVTDVLRLQSEFALAIAGQVRAKLASAAPSVQVRSRQVNSAAYEAYLNGRVLFDRPTKPRLLRSISCFNECIRLDPLYAQAHAAIAQASTFLGIFGFEDPATAFARADAAARRAVDLDDTVAEGHNALAEVKKNECDWDAAQSRFRRALELNPSYALAHTWYGECLSRMGEHDRAIAEAQTARDLDPLSMISNTALGMMLYRGRRYDDAINACQRALELTLHPNALWFQALALEKKGQPAGALAKLTDAVRLSDAPLFRAALGHVQAVLGHKAQARTILARLMRESAHERGSAAYMALIHTGLGDNDAAFALLERSYEQQRSSISILTWPCFDSLRPDPRFSELLQRIGLPASAA